MTHSPDDSMLVDSHAHLDDPSFDADREAVIERARAAGLRYLLSVGGRGPEEPASSIGLAETHDWIYATVGAHPHEAKHLNEELLESLRTLARQPKVVAIGEIGLDYYYDHSPRDDQKLALVRQLELARALKLPVVIHCRDAWADLAEIVAREWASAGLGGILHCFTGSREEAFRYLDWGFLVSFAGIVTFNKADDLRAVARAVPLDRLLTETDSPYLAPVPYRGKRNEPAYVREVTRKLAELLTMSEEEMGQRAVENFARFFKLA